MHHQLDCGYSHRIDEQEEKFLHISFVLEHGCTERKWRLKWAQDEEWSLFWPELHELFPWEKHNGYRQSWCQVSVVVNRQQCSWDVSICERLCAKTDLLAGRGLVNTFSSWTRFSPLKSEKTKPFWVFVSWNCFPFTVFPINRVSAPFMPRRSAMSSRTNDPALRVSSMAYVGSSLSLDPDLSRTGAMGTAETGSCAWAALQLACLNSVSVGVLRLSLELSLWNLVGWWREHVLDVLL